MYTHTHTHTHTHTTPFHPLPPAQLQESNKELELLLIAAEAMGGDGGNGGYGDGTASPAGGVVHDAVRLASPSKGIDRRHRPSPTLTHATPNNTEDSPTSSPTTERRRQLAESQIGTTLSARMAIASGSFSHVSAELRLQSELVEALRFKNADLLYKLQVQSVVHVLTAVCLPLHTLLLTHFRSHTHTCARATGHAG
jgi:hypothetical protein